MYGKKWMFSRTAAAAEGEGGRYVTGDVQTSKPTDFKNRFVYYGKHAVPLPLSSYY